MSKTEETVEGVITEILPNAQFKVQLKEGKEVRAYMSGKMKMHRIRTLVGDTVLLVLDKFGPNNRVVRRLP